MAKLTLQTLGRKLAEKRGAVGIRETAKSIGVSPATLSRVERGHMPDLDTFGKICRWLNVDSADVLGTGGPSAVPAATIGVHFRKDQTLKAETAQALAQMILAAQRALLVSGGGEDIR
jgi:transcriptional regulator with XRE-family HTH domain